MSVRVLSLIVAAALTAGCASQSSTAPGEPTASPITATTAPTPAPPPTATLIPTPARPSATRTAAPAATPTPIAPSVTPEVVGAAAGGLASLRVRLELIAEGFSRPTHVTSAGDGSDRLFVVEQAGRIWILRDGERLAEPFLDLIPLVGSAGNEQGLLSVAFHPRFEENGQFFVNYTDLAGDTVVARYTVDARNPDQVDPRSAMTVLTIDQPAPNHNGGLLAFGPDGMLYIGLGDGGAGGDPWGNGQSLETLLGKLLRIDVDSEEPYAVPPDNPFVGQEGARPEIWAYGLRNPWRFAFDRLTGDLYIADVGQNALEEVHVQPAASPGGENYGWDTMEGNACFRAAECDQTGLELPVAVYSHSSPEGGCSITGGHVYRGAQFPALTGIYFYTDYCTGNLWALRANGDGWENALIGSIAIRTSSFGEDEAGELYLTDRSGGGLYMLVAG